MWNMKTKIISALIGILIISAASFFAYRTIVNLKEDISILQNNNAKLNTAIDTQKQTIESIEGEVSKVIKNYRNLTKKFSDNNKRTDEIIEKLNSYRGRLKNVAVKKPKLVERSINTSTIDLMQLFYEETGGDKQTGKD